MRVLELARNNASSAGAGYIESQHLLLGILHETPSVVRDQFPEKLERIKSELTVKEEKGTPASGERLPLSNECKRILAYAVEEAEKLSHRYIGTEHLFVGVLREEKSRAAKVLHSHETAASSSTATASKARV
jgi:ATP-dependent Clp protease ATP-binding subunit ClpC